MRMWGWVVVPVCKCTEAGRGRGTVGALLNSQLYALERGSPTELGARLKDSKPQGACRLRLRSHGVADTRLGGGFNSDLCTRHFYSLAVSSAPSTDERIEAAGEGAGGVATRPETSVENLHASFFWPSHLVSSAFHLTSVSQVTPSLVTLFCHLRRLCTFFCSWLLLSRAMSLFPSGSF